MLTDWLL